LRDGLHPDPDPAGGVGHHGAVRELMCRGDLERSSNRRIPCSGQWWSCLRRERPASRLTKFYLDGTAMPLILN
jgi:hypothetical protein